MKIGYARVSTDDQNLSLQLDALQAGQRRRPVRGASAVLLSTFLCGSLYSHCSWANKLHVQNKSGVESGVYCSGNSTFGEKANPDGSLTIELAAAGGPPNHGVFSIYGQAAKISDHHWRYEDGMQSSNPADKCQIDITVNNKGWHLLASKDAQCLSNKGAGAPNEAPGFPLNSLCRAGQDTTGR